MQVGLRYKPRWCKLYLDRLEVYTENGRSHKVTVPTADIVVCERCEESLAGMSDVLGIGYRSKYGIMYYLYLASEDLSTTLQDHIRHLMEGDERVLSPTYHPGVFMSKHWNCCLKEGGEDAGCTNVPVSQLTMLRKMSSLSGDGEKRVVSRKATLPALEAHLFDEDGLW